MRRLLIFLIAFYGSLAHASNWNRQDQQSGSESSSDVLNNVDLACRGGQFVQIDAHPGNLPQRCQFIAGAKVLTGYGGNHLFGAPIHYVCVTPQLESICRGATPALDDCLAKIKHGIEVTMRGGIGVTAERSMCLPLVGKK
jgi:hypothetical protein